MRIITVFFCICLLNFAYCSENDWMDIAIEQQFEQFKKNGIKKSLLEITWKRVKKFESFKRYKIISSKVIGPETFIKDLLQVMVAKYNVPDVDFIYYHHDILRSDSFDRRQAYCPIFVSSQEDKKTPTVLFIDWYYSILNKPREFDQQVHAPAWNSLIELMNQNQLVCKWKDKKEIAFWRGAWCYVGCKDIKTMKNYPRGHAVWLSLYKCPNLIDAKCIDGAFLSNELKREIGVAEFTNPLDQLQYKYLIDIDGITCTYPSLQWKLLSGCLVFKQITKDKMWFYPQLKPWIHYVPLKQDLSDLEEKIMWAKTHDEEAYQIAQNARQFILTHVMPEHILLYCYKTLVKYASLQKFTPQP